jgi:hypothetical protein
MDTPIPSQALELVKCKDHTKLHRSQPPWAESFHRREYHPILELWPFAAPSSPTEKAHSILAQAHLKPLLFNNLEKIFQFPLS